MIVRAFQLPVDLVLISTISHEDPGEGLGEKGSSFRLQDNTSKKPFFLHEPAFLLWWLVLQSLEGRRSGQ